MLAVNDLSCYGKCSLTVALPILSSLGVEAVPLPTSVLSYHTAVYDDYTLLDTSEEMQKILSRWNEHGLFFDAVMTGYFANTAQIDICVEYIKGLKRKSFILVDPVMADNGSLYSGFDNVLPKRMRELCSLADIITPNLTEAFLLAGKEYKPNLNEAEVRELAEALLELGPGAVAITGVRAEDGSMQDVFLSDDEFFSFTHPYTHACMHGSGDVFAAALCAKIMAGDTASGAVKFASSFANNCINETIKGGNKAPYGLDFERVLSKGFNYSS